MPRRFYCGVGHIADRRRPHLPYNAVGLASMVIALLRGTGQRHCHSGPALLELPEPHIPARRPQGFVVAESSNSILAGLLGRMDLNKQIHALLVRNGDIKSLVRVNIADGELRADA